MTKKNEKNVMTQDLRLISWVLYNLMSCMSITNNKTITGPFRANDKKCKDMCTVFVIAKDTITNNKNR